MPLSPASVERIRGFWCAWETDDFAPDSISIALVDGERFVRSPDGLGLTPSDLPTDVAALRHALGDLAGDRYGEARLAYADESTARLIAFDAVEELTADDPRLAELKRSTDREEWNESIGGEASDHTFGLVVGDSLQAVSGLEVWQPGIAHLRVFTARMARGTGHGTKVASTAIRRAFQLGLVPQWRARVDNEASRRLAEKLGFVDLGRQTFVSLR